MIPTFFGGVVRGVEGTNNGWSEMADRQARKGANRRRLDNRPAKRIRLNASNTAVNDIQGAMQYRRRDEGGKGFKEEYRRSELNCELTQARVAH